MTDPRPPSPGLARDLTLFTLARIGLLVVPAAVLVVVGVPLLLAMLLSLVVALPLSMVVLRGTRARVVTGLAERGSRRRTERDRLRAQLRGESRDPGTPS